MEQSAKIVKLDPTDPAPAFSRCKEVVSAGGVIAYPTDTFYALGVDPRNPGAVQRLFEIKGREKDQPILLLLGDASQVADWIEDRTQQADVLMKRFWPGPLTLVFRAKKSVLPEMTAGRGTIGLRVPGNALTRELLLSLGSALTGTSANLSGKPSPRTAQEAFLAIGSLVDLILDNGETVGDKPSTIVDVSTDALKVIREGAIPGREILMNVAQSKAL
jgi:L-threonylcarbamoyladenylate synthase